MNRNVSFRGRRTKNVRLVLLSKEKKPTFPLPSMHREVHSSSARTSCRTRSNGLPKFGEQEHTHTHTYTQFVQQGRTFFLIIIPGG